SGRAVRRHAARAPPVGCSLRALREGGEEDGDPVWAVPGHGRSPGTLCRPLRPQFLRRPALMDRTMSVDDQPELRLVGSDEESGQSGEAGSGAGDLVADVIGETGLLGPDKVDVVKRRAGGASFSDALVDEGFASALGVARSLADQY